MLAVIKISWALLLGLGLLMLGNGMQGTLMGIRGKIEGFSTTHMSWVITGYYIGFLFGSRFVPKLIQQVGHVRVFAALGSMISAILVLYAAIPDWMVWTLMRVIIGLSFSGVYIVVESWLNNASTNDTRGQSMALYMMVQMLGIVSAQSLLNFGDASGYILFVVASVLVSLSFTPVLLTVSPAPSFETIKPMKVMTLYKASPLGFVGIFVTGVVFSIQFGMSSIWGTSVGLSVAELTVFVSSIYVGGLLLLYPMGWLSDKVDRRYLILFFSVVGALATFVPVIFPLPFAGLVIVAAIWGAVLNPLYSLLLAYINDYLDHSDMAAASGGVMFLAGLGSISGPLITGSAMEHIGPNGFFLFTSGLFAFLSGYTLWRMSRRPVGVGDGEETSYAAVLPMASVITVNAALGADESIDDENTDDSQDKHPNL